ncbi:VanZ family protein [Mycetocola manganoxydans]|uniref:VanZ family protein n=1 Tax=Mycetocola manganoxydans TaxID=699879 RepID=UPI0015FF55A2|nr:VanZ family protein [Mycetocola manganoxydans]GHD49517.1 hypothetical protein GCM10008097_22450 [Mycetocola manganoxydans]
MLDIRFTIPLIIFAIPALAFLVPLTLIHSQRLGASPSRTLWNGVAVAYLIGVAAVAFFPFQVNIGEYANQGPWWSIINPWPIVTIDIRTFLLNILMTAPLGFLLPMLTRVNTFGRVVLAGALFSLGIEITQIWFGVFGATRTADVNDLIANTLGAAIGFAVFALVSPQREIRRLFPEPVLQR